MEMFTTYITTMDYLAWGIPGLILFILHFFIDSEIIKWTGVGGLIIAIAMLSFDGLDWQLQWVGFFAFILWGLVRNRGANV